MFKRYLIAFAAAYTAGVGICLLAVLIFTTVAEFTSRISMSVPVGGMVTAYASSNAGGSITTSQRIVFLIVGVIGSILGWVTFVIITRGI